MDRTLLTLVGQVPLGKRELALDICLQVIEIAEDLPGGDVGRAARSAALLLFDMAMPEVGEPLRADLARACERAVVVSR
jgi:hypothetical protein